MNIKVILKKLFVGGIWHVGIRDYTKDDKNRGYKKVQTPDGEWVADPFLVQHEGKHYLFCEQFVKNENKAGISCYEIDNGNAIDGRFVIKENYHMSYPCVFKVKDRFYMIPESSANNTIDLYECTDFPYDWKHYKTLLSGEKYVDSTVYSENGNYKLLSYTKTSNGWELVVFDLDISDFSLNRKTARTYPSNVGRPAGFLFKDEAGLIRPAQNCKRKYGESIILYKVDQINADAFSEHEIKKINADSIQFPISIDRIHTINRDNRYEVVDLFEEKIDLLHGFKIFKRAYMKK